MTEPIAVYIDHEQDVRCNLAAEARFGLVAFRKRPKDTGCLHGSVDFGKPEKHAGHVTVRVICLDCSHEWAMCKVLELPKEGGR